MSKGRFVKIVDEDGKIIDNFIIPMNKEVGLVDKKKNLTPSQINYLEEKKEMQTASELLGGYVHMCYIKNELLFDNLNVQPATITRVIYLATYLEYNYKNNGLLVVKGLRDKHIPMTRKVMQSKLGLTDKTFSRFLKDAKDNMLLFETEEAMYLNPEYFSKGKCEFDSKEYTRLYIDPIRNLFDNSKVTQHKRLSYIFRLIPFIHYETNVICYNPNETNGKLIKDMQLSDICDLFNIDRSNGNKFKKDLLKFYVTLIGEKFYFFKYVNVEGLAKDRSYFVVNPYVIYKGGNSEVMKAIAKIFFIDE